MTSFEKMASSHELPKNINYEICSSNSVFASEIPVRRHTDHLPSSNNSTEQTVVWESRKVKPPLDYLIWSSMLVISGVLIGGFVAVVLLIALFRSM